MVNVTAQLQTVVSQATQVVDQSTTNLAVVTAVFTQISNISSPTLPVQNTVGKYMCMWYVLHKHVSSLLRPSSMLFQYSAVSKHGQQQC